MKYFEKIDGLRFFAIMLVLVEHFAEDIGHQITAGYYAVDLFFVISGFLITNILLNTKAGFFTAYKNFVGRRTLRIFPIYYLTLAVLLVAGYEPCREQILYLATYTFNYAWVYYKLELNAVSHFWSLAVEEQFYLFWPIIVLLLRKYPKVLFYSTATFVAACFFQLTTGFVTQINPYNFVGLIPRAGSLCLGALGGMAFYHKRLSDELFGSVVVEWTAIILLVVSLVATYELKYVVLAFASLYLILKSAHSDFSIGAVNRFLKNKTVVYIGTISYGIYIYHLPIGYFITTKLVWPWWNTIDFASFGMFSFVQSYIWVVLLPVYSLLSIGLAILSNKYLEKPILTLKDKFFK